MGGPANVGIGQRTDDGNVSTRANIGICHLAMGQCEPVVALILESPAGSLVTGIPAEAKLRATKSLKAWCLAVLSEGSLHAKL